MKHLRTALALFVLVCGISSFALAEKLSSYNMTGAVTDLWDMDVDYNMMAPITLYRLKNTFPLHEIRFNVLRYQEYCAQWERVCVQYNNAGQCIRWENRCVQIGYQTYPVEKRIELNLRALAALADNENETYQVTIQRFKPFGSGEDTVVTWFRDIKTKVPVIVKRYGDYQYVVEPKP